MNKLKKISIVNGYKTYILAVLIGVASVARTFDLIDAQAYAIIMSILVPGSIASIRHGITNNKA